MIAHDSQSHEILLNGLQTVTMAATQGQVHAFLKQTWPELDSTGNTVRGACHPQAGRHALLASFCRRLRRACWVREFRPRRTGFLLES